MLVNAQTKCMLLILLVGGVGQRQCMLVNEKLISLCQVMRRMWASVLVWIVATVYHQRENRVTHHINGSVNSSSSCPPEQWVEVSAAFPSCYWLHVSSQLSIISLLKGRGNAIQPCGWWLGKETSPGALDSLHQSECWQIDFIKLGSGGCWYFGDIM